MSAAQPRIDRNLNSGWMFTRQNATGAASPACSEKGWERISLPHTWNAQDGQDGGNDCYERVTLSVNGMSQGTKSCDGWVAVWSGVRLTKGRNRIEAAGGGKAGTASDSCTVTCPGGPGGS